MYHSYESNEVKNVQLIPTIKHFSRSNKEIPSMTRCSDCLHDISVQSSSSSETSSEYSSTSGSFDFRNGNVKYKKSRSSEHRHASISRKGSSKRRSQSSGFSNLNDTMNNPIVKIITIFIAAILLNILWTNCPVTLVYKSDLANKNNLRQGYEYRGDRHNDKILTSNTTSMHHPERNDESIDNDNHESSAKDDIDSTLHQKVTREETVQENDHGSTNQTQENEESLGPILRIERRIQKVPPDEKEETVDEQKELEPENAEEASISESINQTEAQIHQENNTKVETNLSNYGNAWEPYTPSQDQPVFWPTSSSRNTILEIMTACYRFKQTLDSDFEFAKKEKLAYITPNDIPSHQDPKSYINCDVSTPVGIQQCTTRGLSSLDSNIQADFLSTPNIHNLNSLFDFTTTKKGKLFAIFQHPVQRSFAQYNLILKENQNDEHLSKMSFEEYINSVYYDKSQQNILTRSLANKEELELEDLNKAMSLINQKFIVGLSSNETSTLERFEKYFKWSNNINPAAQEQCRNAILSSSKEIDVEGSSNPLYKKIFEWNNYDIELYNYIVSLYAEQAEFVADVQDDYRISPDIASCAKCVPPTFPKGSNADVAPAAAVAAVGTDLSFKAPVINIPSFDGFKGKIKSSIHVLSITY